MRVLVVDDHDVVHWGFRVLLGEQPWVERCLAARTGEEALELVRRFEPDVALIDLFVGRESGVDVCQAVRRASPADARASDLRRRTHVAGRRPRSRGLGVRLEGPRSAGGDERSTDGGDGNDALPAQVRPARAAPD